jgi:hypothetical protein
MHAGQNIDAGGQMQLDQAMGDAFGLLAIGAGAENDLKIGHRYFLSNPGAGREQPRAMFTKYGSFYPKRENFHLKEEAKQRFTEKIEQIARRL